MTDIGVRGPGKSATADAALPLLDGARLTSLGQDWTRLAGPLVSIAILAAAAWQLRGLNVHDLVSLVPASIGFWAAFALYYSAGPLSEWVIFRRLWGLPASGLAALYRKLVSNSLLMGYLGEAYFYAWARARMKLIAAPFGAVKDVAVLSALAGNVATLAMVAVAAPSVLGARAGLGGHTLAVSVLVMLASTATILLGRRRLFSLARADLWFTTALHLVRIAATIFLSGLLWHLILPGVALGIWVLLATLRQLVTRLPLVPNKDVVFAGLATMFVGREGQVVDAVALVASLILLANLLVGLLLGLAELLRVERVAD